MNHVKTAFLCVCVCVCVCVCECESALLWKCEISSFTQ